MEINMDLFDLIPDDVKRIIWKELKPSIKYCVNGKLILPNLTKLDTTTTQISNAIYYYEDTDTYGSGVGGDYIKLLSIYA